MGFKEDEQKQMGRYSRSRLRKLLLGAGRELNGIRGERIIRYSNIIRIVETEY